MNKHVKISLIVLVAVVLLLALTIPVLAKKPVYPNPNCYAYMPTVHVSGNLYGGIYVFGALEAYWEDGVQYNYCTGIIPWGEETSIPGWRLLTFNEAAEYYADYNVCQQNFCWTDNTMWFSSTVPIYDPVEKMTLSAEIFYAAMYRNGEFLYYKEYVR